MPKNNKSRYSYGKTFVLNGKSVRYRYTDKKKSTKKLVPVRVPSRPKYTKSRRR